MESNKDEAFKCRSIALRAIQEGDTAKAIRFLEKAQRMYPDEKTEEKLKELRSGATASASPNGNSNENTSSNAKPKSPRIAKAAPASSPQASPTSSSSSSAAPPASEPKQYTPEQEAACQKILKTKDYYQVLGVERGSAEEVIRKQYKKLALQLHPDKCKAPSAEEAFKKVAKVFQCLNDANKRAMYDQFGNDDDAPQQFRSQYEADLLTPEELFSFFFGVNPGMNGQRTVYRRHRGAQGQTRQHFQQQAQYERASSNNNWMAGIPNLLPLIILLLVSFLSNSFTPQRAAFSLAKTGDFPIERRTDHANLPYFVAADFAREFPRESRKLKEIERQIERSHVASLSQRCEQEEYEWTAKMRIAQTRGNVDDQKKIYNTQKPSCNKLRKLKTEYPLLVPNGQYYSVY